MSFQRYKKYRDSKVEWLGEVPEYWKIGKFRHFFMESQEKIEDAIIGQMLSVSGYRGIEIKEYDDENHRRLDEDLIGYRIVRVGQLVVNTMWLNYAGLGVSPFEGHVSPAYRSYQIAEGLEKQFLHYLMRCDRYVKGYTKFLTGIRPNSLQMSREDLMEVPILVPPQEEQNLIVTFLDRETTKIGTLIAEKQRLIELLKERRHALISHAVTKGLNPDAPMKDSGVEWLGEVPEDWSMKRLRFISIFNPSKAEINHLDRNTLVTFLPMESIGNDGLLNLDQEKMICEVETGYTFFRDGDVTIAKITPCFENFKGALMQNLLHNIGFGTTELIVARPNSEVMTGQYMHWLFVSSHFRKLGEAHMYGAGGQKRVPDDFVRNFAIGVPPLVEQTVIASYLDHETSKIDLLISEANKAIALLQERRTALISAAVTGKIDVRGTIKQEAS